MEVLLIADTGGPVRREVDRPLREDGYAVVGFDQPEPLLAHLRAGAGDAVLLDTSHVPQARHLVSEITKLTGKPILAIHRPDDRASTLELLQHGACDFVCRDPRRDPSLHPEELRARVATVIHQAAWRDRPEREWLSCGELTIDLTEHGVWNGDQQVELSRTEYQLLLRLVANPHMLLSYDDLLRNVWSEQQCGRVHYLRTYICRLRKKLGWTTGTGSPQIQSVRGEGYRLMLHRTPPALPES